MDEQHTTDPDALLDQAENLLHAGEQRKAALTARRVIEEHDFCDERAWRFLHGLVSKGRSFEEFQQEVAQKYYPDRAHLLSADVAESSIFPQPETESQEPEAPSGAKTLGTISVICGVIGLIAFGIPLGVIAVLTGIPALAMNAGNGKAGIILGVVDIVLAILLLTM
jgi:hypothetical protein